MPMIETRSRSFKEQADTFIGSKLSGMNFVVIFQTSFSWWLSPAEIVDLAGEL